MTTDKVYEKYNTPRHDDECWDEDGIGEINGRLVLVEAKNFRTVVPSKHEGKKVMIRVNQFFIHVKTGTTVTTFKVYEHRKVWRYRAMEWETIRYDFKFGSPKEERTEMLKYMAATMKITFVEASDLLNEWTGV